MPGDHVCKNFNSRNLESYDASAILGAPFPVILGNGVEEVYCEVCKKTHGVKIEKPEELIAVASVVRACNPLKLNGKEIRFLRKSLNASAKELAEYFSTTAETLSRYENDKVPISDHFEKLLRVSVCIYHADKAKGLDANIRSVHKLKIKPAQCSSRTLVVRLVLGEMSSRKNDVSFDNQISSKEIWGNNFKYSA